jgi:hypothetical protein
VGLQVVGNIKRGSHKTMIVAGTRHWDTCTHDWHDIICGFLFFFGLKIA